jgi:hypothetical protein
VRNRWIELAAPLIVCAWMFLPDDRSRWLAIGIITAVALSFVDDWLALIVGVALVRWIPWQDVVIWRELIVTAGIGACWGAGVLAGRSAGVSTALIPIAVAVVTPAYPAKGLFFPFVVAACMLLPLPFRLALSALFLAAIALARYSFEPMLVVAASACAWPLLEVIPTVPRAAAVALLALWPWSGVLARSLPAFLRSEPRATGRKDIWQAARVPATVSVEVPEGTRSITLTASAGDAMHLWPGSALGHVAFLDSGGRATTRDLTIGDVADFGFMRREHFLTAHNAPARLPVADVRGFGASAWLYGAGRVVLHPPRDARELRIIPLRPGIAIQVESLEPREAR